MSARGRGTIALVAALTALAVAVACGAPRAQAVVYWGSETAFGAANDDGTVPVFSYPYELRGMVPGASVCGLAVSGTDLYWADRRNGAIGRLGLPRSSSGIPRRDIFTEPLPLNEGLVGGLAGPCGIAVDGSHLYWASTAGLAIGRANLDGSGVEPNFIAGASAPCGVAVDGTHIYWANLLGDTISRANLAGGEVEPSFIAGADRPCGVAVDGGHIYWANDLANGSIGRANLAGGEVEQGFVPALEYPCGVAVNGTHVYWSSDFIGQRVGRAGLDGGDVNSDLVPNPYGVSCGVALDARVFQPPPPPPSAPFFLGKARRSRGTAVTYLTAKVPKTGGALEVITKGLEWRVLGPPVPERGYMLWQIKVWPASAGRAAHRIRRQLARTGHADLVLEVTYQEAGRGPYLAVRPLTLVRRGAPTSG